MRVTYRPIGADWPAARTPSRQRLESRFKSAGRYIEGQGYQHGRPVPWPQTLALLERELCELGAQEVIFQIDVREGEIRLDGMPSARARPTDPGVIISFASKHGPLRYFCDRFTDWQANVRAIALGLEALRKVDRYGITRKGEQYSGWKALPAGDGKSEGVAYAFSNPKDAASWLLTKVIPMPFPPHDSTFEQALVNDPHYRESVFRAAAKKCHPDVGGNDTDWKTLVEVRKVLENAAQ